MLKNPPPQNSRSPNPSAGRMWALIPCAGMGARAGSLGPKQYEMVAGKPMVMHTLAAFAAVQRLQGVLVVVSPGDTYLEGKNTSVLIGQCGGTTRAMSVFNGLTELVNQGANPNDWVLVHDAARCLITPEQINSLIDACVNDPVGGLLALKLPDTLKSEKDGRVLASVERADKWLAQTPQMFRIAQLQDALRSAGAAVTDESSAMEFVGLHPLLVQGSVQNFKVTYPQDFDLAQAVLHSRASPKY